MSGARRRFGLLGDPVAHSISPRLYEAAFAALRLPAAYAALRVAAGEVTAAMRELAATGGGNVTLPHKEEAARGLEWRTEEVALSGACNCFWRDDRGRLAGDNTDVGGFLAAVAEGPPGGLDGRSVLLLGAGGAARAVLLACARAGAARVEILNRTPERAEVLAEGFAGRLPEVRAIRSPDAAPGRYDLVVNATRLGLAGDDPLPLDPRVLRPAAALDLVYAPGGTRWVRATEALGIPARDGRGMLVHQAALALRRWLGVEPPLRALREAAERALRPAAAEAASEGEAHAGGRR